MTAVDASPKMLAGLRAKLAREATPLDVDVRGGDVDEIAPTLAGPYDGIISSFAALNTVNLAGFAPHAARLLGPGGRFVCHMLASGHGRSAWSRLTRAAPRGTRTVVVGSEPLIHLDVSPDDIYRRFFAADFEAKGSYALGLFVGGAAEARLPEVLLDLLGRVESIIGAMPALASRGRFFVLDLQRRPS